MARILIVDDDHMIRDLLQATLSFGEQEIVVAHDGAAALAAFAMAPPDVVILDLDLPGNLGGLGILENLKARGTRAQFIVLTGSGRGREAALRSAGAIGYLTKPFSPIELIGQIEVALSKPS